MSDDYAEAEEWIGRIERIDALLEKAAPTILDITWEYIENAGVSKKPHYTVPQYVSEHSRPRETNYLLAHALCCSTIQKLYLQRRRYRFLKDDQIERLNRNREKIALSLAAPAPKDPASLEYLKLLESHTFGDLNPLTASEVYWVLIRAGEQFAYGPLGTLCVFSLLWSLNRHQKDPGVRGAALEPWWPTAFVTAKCLFPLEKLWQVLKERARKYRDIARTVTKLARHAGKATQHDRWRFTILLERLATDLHHVYNVTICRDATHDTGEAVEARARGIGPRSDTGPVLEEICRLLASLLGTIGSHDAAVKRDAQPVVETLIPSIIAHLETPELRPEFIRDYCHQLRDDGDAEYWADHVRAAGAALDSCRFGFQKLQEAIDICNSLSGAVPGPAALADALERLATTNDAVADRIKQDVSEASRWCLQVVKREVAHASAQNDTDFDASELASAIAIVERWNQLSSLEIEDAILQSIRGARTDGSWSGGQPIFLHHRILGVWPNTPDLIWHLANAVNGKPFVRHADNVLEGFVKWLERTVQSVNVPQYPELKGWASENFRESGTIDVWTTAVSVNALMEIRELMETRLWEICTRRFSVRTGLKSLEEIDPVDLGAKHESRLHARLMRMARRSKRRQYSASEYSLVLHGPPGSSKTAVAEAFGREWSSERDPTILAEPKVLRITPADFTRQGEAGLDFEARFIFRVLTHIRGAMIFFDEIDDLLRQRRPGEEPSFLKIVVPAMLNRLQDLRDAAPRQEIAFVLATNFIDKIEPALTRPGRIDSPLPVPYPDPVSREAILQTHMNREGSHTLTPALLDHVVRRTYGWPWSTYNSLCRRIVKRQLTWDEVEQQLELSNSEFQSADVYYFDAERWRRASSPLVNEFVHHTFAVSPLRDACSAELQKLVRALQNKSIDISDHRFEQIFDSRAQRQERFT